MDYVLQRYRDWIYYRTNWFMGDRNQQFGPELALMGNSRILWTTADESKLLERQLIIGCSKWYQNRFTFPKAWPGTLLIGKMNGEFNS